MRAFTGIVLAAVLAGCGKKESGGATGPGGPPPQPAAKSLTDRWRDFTSPADGFKASFPWDAPLPGVFHGEKPRGTIALNVHGSTLWRGNDSACSFSVVAARFQPTRPATAVEDMARSYFVSFLGMKAEEPKAVTWGGRPATEVGYERAGREGRTHRVVARLLQTDTAGYIGYSSDDSGQLRPEEIGRFFDSFSLLPRPAPQPGPAPKPTPAAAGPKPPAPIPPTTVRGNSLTAHTAYRIIFPAPPRSVPSAKAAWSTNGLNGSFYAATHLYGAPGGEPLRTSQAGFFHYPPGATAADKQTAFARVVGDAARVPAGYKEVSRRQVRAAGQTWEEVTTRAADKEAAAVVRTHDAGSRVYLLAVYRGDGTTPDADQEKFLAAFEFVK